MILITLSFEKKVIKSSITTFSVSFVQYSEAESPLVKCTNKMVWIKRKPLSIYVSLLTLIFTPTIVQTISLPASVGEKEYYKNDIFIKNKTSSQHNQLNNDDDKNDVLTANKIGKWVQVVTSLGRRLT